MRKEVGILAENMFICCRKSYFIINPIYFILWLVETTQSDSLATPFLLHFTVLLTRGYLMSFI